MTRQNRSLRLLGVFAHPDDESFCVGGTLAKYTAAGAEAMIVSATRGQAGQIRDARIATRKTLGAVREQELRRAARPWASSLSSVWTTRTARCRTSTDLSWSAISSV